MKVRGLVVVAVVMLGSVSGELMAEASEPPKDLLMRLLVEKSPLTLAEEQQLARYFAKETEVYLAEISTVSHLDFKGRTDMTAEVAASLVQEANSVRESLVQMVDILKFIEQHDTSSTEFAWILVARQISTSMAEMNDLQQYEIVDSDWNVGLRIYLRGIFDRIIIPKIQGSGEGR